jgi:hypothetical protein
MATRKRKRSKSSQRGRKKSTGRRKSSGRKKSSSRTRKSSSRTGSRKKGGRKKAGRKKGSRRKYSPSAGGDVKKEMHEFKRGEARSGRSGRKVKNRKQAIAIGLSKARRKGKRVPPKPGRSRR